MNTKAWRYIRSGYGSKQADFDIVTASGGRVASTPYEDRARLIAALPDLLAALRALKDTGALHVSLAHAVKHPGDPASKAKLDADDLITKLDKE